MSLSLSTAPALVKAPGRPDAPMLAALAVAAAIAALQPFDLAFAAATFGVPLLRSALIVGLALAGGWAARHVGLQIAPAGQRHPLLAPVLVSSCVAVFCAVVDLAFRPLLHPGYAQVIATTPLGLRIAAFMMRAFNENILYRLFLGSGLAWALGRVWRDASGRPAEPAFWCAFALSQALNVWINVSSQAPVSPLSLLHDSLRYFAPGMVWSWLYLRRGFQANEIASMGVHLVFQPLVGALLRA